MAITDFNYDRVIQEKPEYVNRISRDFLSNPDTKYTEGVKGIANAYIPAGDHNLIINEKNALYAMLLQLSVELQATNPYFDNPYRNFDKCVQLLMPTDLEADMVSSNFYRGLLRGAGVKDDTRNALNSKAFKDLFQYKLTSRFTCINEEIGSKYSEEQIAGISEDLFDEIKAEEEERCGGRLIMTDFIRAMIQEKCATILAEVYGWKFAYREYDDIIVDEDLMDMVKMAFPALVEVINQVRETALQPQFGPHGPAVGKYKLDSEDLNPVAQTEIYAAAKRRGLAQIEEMIEYTEEGEKRYILRHKNPMVTDEMLCDEYVTTLVREWLGKANDRRGVNPSPAIVERDIYEITICIRNKQMRWH